MGMTKRGYIKWEELLEAIRQAKREGAEELNLTGRGITELPEEIGELTSLRSLYLSDNKLATLPEELGELAELRILDLSFNVLTALPKSIGNLTKLEVLHAVGVRAELDRIGAITSLRFLNVRDGRLHFVPESFRGLRNLEHFRFDHTGLTSLPQWFGELTSLRVLEGSGNKITRLPNSMAQLTKLEILNLNGNPLSPALQSALQVGRYALRSYLRSIEKPEEVEALYEAKLVLVGEGGAGKTSLLNALTGREPRADEPTTHGVNIDIESLRIKHPEKDVEIRLNAWDFGGQKVYRVTHQFFFSRRSIYLLVWEPRIGVEQGQVAEWLKMVRLRVGDDARVIIVSTHSRTGERIARIDKPVFERDFGSMIAGFHEVDSLVDDPATGEKAGIAELKTVIAEVAKDLEQMGTPINRAWLAARDELLELDEAHISYGDFAAVCERHGLEAIDAKTLADQMDYLGYIVYYGDDERLKGDVVLKPQWLTKAIGFVLEDRKTAEMAGILPDARLMEVWHDHPFEGETRYGAELHPFFLRLMEKYDVSYRLRLVSKDIEDASLVAQHVPQERPKLPWLPGEQLESGQRQIELICAMDEEPRGLVPWMIVRTHEFAAEQDEHRLHWQKGMFLNYKDHGSAMLEVQGRDFHIYVQARWPKRFLDVVKRTLDKLIEDNWPGIEGRFRFVVPCAGPENGAACQGRFPVDFLHNLLEEQGVRDVACQTCFSTQDVEKLLYGLKREDEREEWRRATTGMDDVMEELRRMSGKIEAVGGDVRVVIDKVDHYFLALMRAVASESKDGPRLFTIEPVDGKWWQVTSDQFRLHLWCEADGCQHPVLEEGQGTYEFKATREWVQAVAPYANLVAGILKTLLPVAAPASIVLFGADKIDQAGLTSQLDIIKQATDTFAQEFGAVGPKGLGEGTLTEPERSGVRALHSFLREKDPNQQDLGLVRVPTYTGDYVWLCRQHYEAQLSKIPDSFG